MDTDATIEQLNQLNKNTMMEVIGVEYLEAGSGFLKARMPVNNATKQPNGILHGGANLALAETVAGLGSAIMVDLTKYDIRGAQVSANHVGTANSGWVYAEGKLIHKGKNTHVWNIDIRNEEEKLLSTCRLTNFIILKCDAP
jgi:1,4-dihydroxy-2-naphthoyl-CoA hydrolase